jgi:hypothetical protein
VQHPRWTRRCARHAIDKKRRASGLAFILLSPWRRRISDVGTDEIRRHGRVTGRKTDMKILVIHGPN